MSEVLACDKQWRHNADMIADVAKLGYLNGAVLDATYGHGKFWTEHRPASLTTNDLHKNQANGLGEAEHGYDYANWPTEMRGRFNAVVYDPPYKLNGTPTLRMDRAYGVDKPASMTTRLDSITTGATACAELVKPGGYLLIKVQDQASSGKQRWQTKMVDEALNVTGLHEYTRFYFAARIRPQPKGRRVLRPRSNVSVLMVYRKRQQRAHRK